MATIEYNGKDNSIVSQEVLARVILKNEMDKEEFTLKSI